MAESYQKTLKVDIHSASLFDVQDKKRDSVKIGRQVRLLYLWARHLTGLPLLLSG